MRRRPLSKSAENVRREGEWENEINKYFQKCMYQAEKEKASNNFPSFFASATIRCPDLEVVDLKVVANTKLFLLFILISLVSESSSL